MTNKENIIFKVTKNRKADILGLWKDEAGKVYIDYIEAVKPKNAGEFEAHLFNMFASGEKCVFVKGRETAFIVYQDGTTERLSTRTQTEVLTLSFEEIKYLLSKNGGLTIYKENGGYILESWTK